MSGAVVLTQKNPRKKIQSKLCSNMKAVQKQCTQNGFKFKTKNSSCNRLSVKSYQNLMMGKNRLHGFENWGKEEIITKNNLQKKLATIKPTFI